MGGGGYSYDSFYIHWYHPEVGGLVPFDNNKKGCRHANKNFCNFGYSVCSAAYFDCSNSI